MGPSAIVETRRRLGMTQDQLARFLRVDRNTVLRWEAGQHRPTRHLAECLLLIAEQVGVRPDEEEGDAADAS